MFDFGFSEVLLTSVIALIVLGPEKLPRAASQVGRWVGRARAMARQFREQLEEEVNLENVKKAHKEEQAKREAAGEGTGTAGTAGTETTGTPGPGTAETGTAGTAGTVAGAADGAATGSGPSTHSTQPNDTQAATSAPFGSQISPDPTELRADTFSHAHPTDEFGANPLTRNGAAEVTPPPAVESPAANVEGVPSANPEEWAQPAAPPTSAHRPDANEAYAATNASAPEQTHTTTTSPTDAEKSGHV